MNNAGVLADAQLGFDRTKFQVVLFALGILDVETKLEAFDEVQIRRDNIRMMKENSLPEVIAGRALKESVGTLPSYYFSRNISHRCCDAYFLSTKLPPSANPTSSDRNFSACKSIILLFFLASLMVPPRVVKGVSPPTLSVLRHKLVSHDNLRRLSSCCVSSSPFRICFVWINRFQDLLHIFVEIVHLDVVVAVLVAIFETEISD